MTWQNIKLFPDKIMKFHEQFLKEYGEKAKDLIRLSRLREREPT